MNTRSSKRESSNDFDKTIQLSNNLQKRMKFMNNNEMDIDIDKCEIINDKFQKASIF